MTQEIDILKLVCSRLEEANVAYMLTGSFAANFYAVPRMTRDIDIVIEIPKSDVEKIFQIFQDDFYVERDAIFEALQYQSMFNIIHNESVIKIDLIVRKDSLYRNEEFQRRRRIKLNNTEIWIVSPEDLIISKLVWAKESLSQIQIKDVKNLIQSVKSIDEKYIINWVRVLKLDSIYEKVDMDG